MKAEDNIISYLLSNEEINYSEIIDNLSEEYFTKEKYCKVYRVIKEMLNNGDAITQNTILLNLKASDYFDIMTLNITFAEYNASVKKLKAEYLKRIVKEKLKITDELLDSDSSNNDIQACLSSLVNELNNIQLNEDKKQLENVKDVVEDYLIHLDELKSGKPLGLKTGWKELDKYLYGNLDGNRVCVIGAMESIGKSAFALNLTLNLLRQEHKVLYVSLEMTENQIMPRLLSNSTKIPFSKFKNTDNLSEEEYYRIGKAAQEIGKSGLYINTDFNINSDGVLNYALKLKKTCGLDAVIIDHIQLLAENEKGNKDKEKIDRAIRRLKYLSKTLNIPVFILAQVNRSPNGNDPFCMIPPNRKRLKESGNLEADADIVIILHRQLYDENGLLIAKLVDNLYVAVDKNRDGQRGSFYMNFDLTTQSIEEKEEFNKKLGDNISITN